MEEENILRSLKGCKYVPKILNSGRHEDKVNFIVMDLLGENLSALRRRATNQTFSLLTTLMLGMQMLRAIKEVHDAGYLHRDIKPGNFVLGTERTNNPRTVILIDFGLAKKHLEDDGSVKPKRNSARWVGSRRYMSLNTHLRKEQARRDDLWSLLYVLLEFLQGTLPWAHFRGGDNLDKVRDMKMQYNNEKLVRGLPEEFMKFMNHLKTLKYETRPDYDLLHGLLKTLFERNGGSNTTPFDWESAEQVSQNNLAMDSLDEVSGSEKKHSASGDISGSENSSASAPKEKTDKAKPSPSTSEVEKNTKTRRCTIL
uniref:non-specific serine/threonine protein kinase n=1 Tax=Arcella intermedia TaxID=1963864 RepID=A0A6B2L871_9EUKA